MAKRRKKVLFSPGTGKQRSFCCITEKEWLGGVCAGVAYWLAVPVWIVRLLWFLVAWCYGAGLLIYLLLWIFVPNAPGLPPDYGERTGDFT
jgi:phage shock protein PspC (stress-responsive transcriptional regulator)